MSLAVAVASGVSPTTTGTQAVTVNLGGLTPSCIEMYLCFAGALNSQQNQGIASIGFSDGTNNVAKLTAAPSGYPFARGYCAQTECGVLTDVYSFDSTVEVAVSSFGANTVTLNWTKNALAANYAFVIVAYAGTAIGNATAGIHTGNASSSPSTTTLGWRPTFVKSCFMDTGKITLPLGSNTWGGIYQIGILTDNSNEQMGTNLHPYDGIDPCQVHGAVNTNRHFVHTDPTYCGTGAITATGFTNAFSNGNAPSLAVKVPFLAVRLVGAQCKVLSFTTPAGSAGNVNLSFGFTPIAVFVSQTELAVTNTDVYSTDARAISFGAYDGTNHGCMSILDAINSTNNNWFDTYSLLFNNKIAHILDNQGGTVGLDGTVSSLGASTVLNYSTVKSTARYGVAFALAEGGGGGGASSGYHGGALLF